MKKYIKMLIIGILLIVGINSCSTLSPPPDGPEVVYYLPKYGYFDKNYHYTYPHYYYYSPYYRPAPHPRPKPNTPPPRPNNGNKRHR